MRRLRFLRILCLLAPIFASCRAANGADGQPALHYVGSSTIANFLRDVEPVFGRVRFVLDTEPESAGGEAAILEGRADLAGVAGRPARATLELGVTATLLGNDAIAVIVHPANPVVDLSSTQLREIFTGRASNWNAFGGANLPIRPFIVGPGSATRKVFRSAVLGADDYGGCEVVTPDAYMIPAVASEPGAIGQISFSFLGDPGDVEPIAVDGQAPLHTNSDYPITRPLYLLWWRGRTRVAEFVSWTLTEEAQTVLLRRFTKASRFAEE